MMIVVGLKVLGLSFVVERRTIRVHLIFQWTEQRVVNVNQLKKSGAQRAIDNFCRSFARLTRRHLLSKQHKRKLKS